MANNCTCVHQSLLKCLDIFFCITWVHHLVVACWRGTWILLDTYVLPGDLHTGSWLTFIGGIVLCATVKSLSPTLQENVTSDQKALKFVLSRCLMYVSVWGTIGQWRGLWNIGNSLWGYHWYPNLVVFLCSILSLGFLRTSVNALGSPFALVCDFRPDVFMSQPRMRTNPSRQWDHMVDHFISQFLVESLVASTWRALWNVYNDIKVRYDLLLASLAVWVGGLLLSMLILSLESPVNCLTRKCSKVFGFGARLFIEYIYIVAAFLANVAVWNGWWAIMDYIIPAGPLFSGALPHFLGALCLLCTATAATLCNSTVAVDGESSAGFRFHINFFQTLWCEKNDNTSNGDEDTSVEKNGNEEDDSLVSKLPEKGSYIRCSTDMEVADMHLTSV